MTDRAPDSQLQANGDWAFALDYYPDLRQIVERLSAISDALAAEYTNRLLASKNFAARSQLASAVENEYCEKHFGTSAKIVQFARTLIAQGEHHAARELSRAVTLFGDGDPDAIIGRIRGKYFFFETQAGETCTPECIQILRAAADEGYTISVAADNSITMSKIGRGQTHLHSVEHILRFAHFLKR